MKHEYDANEEDRRHDDDVVRKLDDLWEKQLTAARRNSAGASPEELTLLDAYVEGRKAGRDLQSPEMNPYQPGTEKARAWECGRVTALGQVARRVA